MSSLKAIYQGYLARPDASAFAPNASLHYVTTLTTIHKADAIAKHLVAHQRVLKKKNENILSTVEGKDSMCAEVETTIEFVTGGGTYLPGLDDNFLADQVVTFPIIHIVNFDTDQKIQQIRLAWDQASVLKQVEVIGSRAKNWPIRDGKDQVRLIVSSAAAITEGGSLGPDLSNHTNGTAGVVITSKPTEARRNVARDPHTSLSLFAPPNEDYESSQKPAVVAPRAGAKLQQRDYHELFAGNESDASPNTRSKIKSPKKENKGIGLGSKDQSAKPAPRDYHDLFGGDEPDASAASEARPASPQKENASVAPKGGAGKNFQPSRLFDAEDGQPTTPGMPSPEKMRKAHPTKYNHFDFSDEPGEQKAVPAGLKTKHQSQWDFADFTTPNKISQKIRSQDVRHFALGDENANMESPVKKPFVHQPRPDAKTNFEFLDDGASTAERRPPGHPRGHVADRGAGLYQNNIFTEDRSTSPEKKASHPLSTVTNLKDRRKDFDSHFSITDNSPAAKDQDNKPIPEARAKVVKMMEAQWEAADESPGQESKTQGKATARGKENTGIKSAGDGMGSRKGTGRQWGIGDLSDEEETVRFQPARKQMAPREDSFWDY